MNINWHDLITSAWESRQAINESDDFDCWRIFHGYSEGAEGVVIEKFGTLAIVEYKDDIRDDLNIIKDALLSCFPFTVIIAKGHQSTGLTLQKRKFAIYGEIADAPKICKEYGTYFSIDPDAMHNCGLYLDARPVRQWLVKNSSSLRILNLFSFTGSLGAAALMGNAKEVVQLDKSKDLLPKMKKTYDLNDLEFDSRSFLQGDIYKHLPKAIKNKQVFDGIILDPPPKVYSSPHSDHRPQGQDFSKLVKLSCKLLNSKGWLICLFHHFDKTWNDAESEIIESSEQCLKVIDRLTSGPDFPENIIDKKLRITIFKKQ